MPWSRRAALAPGQPLTVITPVRPEALDDLRTLLSRIRRGGIRLPFERLANVHFLRWALLEPSTGHDKTSYGPQLIYAAVIDGKPEEHLEDLVRLTGHTLLEIYAHCEGCPKETGGNSSASYLVARAPDENEDHLQGELRSPRQAYSRGARAVPTATGLYRPTAPVLADGEAPGDPLGTAGSRSCSDRTPAGDLARPKF